MSKAKTTTESRRPQDAFRAADRFLHDILPGIARREIPVLRSRDTREVLLNAEDVQILADGDHGLGIVPSDDPRVSAIHRLKAAKAAFLLRDTVGATTLQCPLVRDAEGRDLLTLGDVVHLADILIAQARGEPLH